MTVPALRVRWEVTIFGTFGMFMPKGVGAGLTTKILRIFHSESTLHFHLSYGKKNKAALMYVMLALLLSVEHPVENMIVASLFVVLINKHFFEVTAEVSPGPTCEKQVVQL